MSELFLSALALVLVFEGLLPFVNPAAWRRMFMQAMQLTDPQLRMVGLAAVLLGLVLLWAQG